MKITIGRVVIGFVVLMVLFSLLMQGVSWYVDRQEREREEARQADTKRKRIAELTQNRDAIVQRIRNLQATGKHKEAAFAAEPYAGLDKDLASMRQVSLEEIKIQAALEAKVRATEAEMKRLIEGDPAKRNENIEAAAQICKQLVTKGLKDPYSAKWEEPWHTGSNSRVSGHGTIFELQLVVRAKNSFGAYGLSRFDCMLQKSGNNWNTMKLEEIS